MPSKNENQDLNDLLQQAIDLYRAGRVNAAASLLRVSTSRFPDSGKLWGYLGFLQKQRGAFKEAARCFQRAVRISPSSEKASLGLFFGLYRAGKSRGEI